MSVDRMLLCLTVFVVSMAATFSVVSWLFLNSGSAADGWLALPWLWLALVALALSAYLIAGLRDRG
jgi:hypothetical protein